jgi:protein-S-isoprenylcysteine O-methyltransferase Ste14
MTEPGNPPQPASPQQDWIALWQQVARRIRVPLGFVTAVLYLFELWRRPPQPAAVALSLALVLPGLWLRGYASGYVKKNRELTVTGPYAYTRNPLYLGSMLMAAGFALALKSWPVALVLAAGFWVIYVPVIASEERFLRAAFPGFDEYCRRAPRLIPRLTRARHPSDEDLSLGTPARHPNDEDLSLGTPAHPGGQAGAGSFSLSLYIQHREYNAAIGAALLYLSLLLLRPALAAFVNVPR